MDINTNAKSMHAHKHTGYFQPKKPKRAKPSRAIQVSKPNCAQGGLKLSFDRVNLRVVEPTWLLYIPKHE